MVRIKHRYLLLNLLYPSDLPPPSSCKPDSSTSSPLLALHAPTPAPFDARALLSLLRLQLALLFGDMAAGAAGAGLKIMYYSGATSTAVVRCRREAWRVVWAACAFVAKVGKREVVVAVRRVSGTVRGCEEEIVRGARRLAARVRGGAGVEGSGQKEGRMDPARGGDEEEGEPEDEEAGDRDEALG